MSYSQYEEEQHILKALGGRVGTFMDIGAYHPMTFSNTRALFERGWSGVMVEPSPGPFMNLLMACSKCGDIPPAVAYGDRYKVVSVPCIKCGETLRYGMHPRLKLILGMVGFAHTVQCMQVTDDAVSTSDDPTYERWKKEGGYYGSIYTPVIPLDALLKQFGAPDFINFDAEGTSADLALFMFNQTSFRPRCICVEHDGRLVEIQATAQKQRYFPVYTNGTNLILARSEK